MDYFKNLLDLLKIERQEDRLQYQLLTEKSSVADRRANGLTWYPIAIRGSEMSQGDYITVEVERTSHLEISHQLRYGMPAVFFGNHDPQNDRVEGVIAYLSGNRLKITLKTDELPDWARDGKLGIDLLFDDNSYDEMNQALKQAEVISASKTSLLRDVLIGNKKPTFNTEFKPRKFLAQALLGLRHQIRQFDLFRQGAIKEARIIKDIWPALGRTCHTTNSRTRRHVFARCQIVDDGAKALCRQILMVIIMNGNDGRIGAGPHAFHLFPREQAVGGHVVVIADSFLADFDQIARAAQHARRGAAYLQMVFADRGQVEHRIEGRHFIDADIGHAEVERDLAQRRLTHPTFLLLRQPQQRDDRRLLAGFRIFTHPKRDFCGTVGRPVKRLGLNFRRGEATCGHD